jgi:hypothetical protein
VRGELGWIGEVDVDPEAGPQRRFGGRSGQERPHPVQALQDGGGAVVEQGEHLVVAD